jgi:rare lipoprotein A
VFCWLALGALAALLGGCGSAPLRDDAAGVAPDNATRKPDYVLKHGGGYYKDDGPGDAQPDNLDNLPDAVPREEPLRSAANKPYSIFGTQYVPFTGFVPYRERGVASWYGRKFHGQPTSIGEPYDMYAMTAAHPRLPLPSYARVTSLENGRSVVVRVIDRGPFLKGRLIDLSYAAAYRLGYLGQGSARVEVELLVPGSEAFDLAARGAAPQAVTVASAAPVRGPEPLEIAPLAAPAQPPSVLPAPGLAPAYAEAASAPAVPVATASAAPDADPGRGAFVQLGAFSSRAGADSLTERVREQLSWLGDRLHVLADDGRYRVHAGPYASAEEARDIGRRIAAALRLQPFLVWR